MRKQMPEQLRFHNSQEEKERERYCDPNIGEALTDWDGLG
jgi:hypothetical protein